MICWDLNFFCQPGVFATVPLKDYLFRDLDRGHFWMVAARVSLPWRWEIPEANGCFYGKSMGKLGKTRYKWRCFMGNSSVNGVFSSKPSVIDYQRITINYSKIIEIVL